MTDFKERWERMTVVEKIAHMRSDWESCRDSEDPLVLSVASAVAHDVCRQAADEIERLRKERDEARREVCAMLGGKGGRSSSDSPDAVDVARQRGWDCFREVKP